MPVLLYNVVYIGSKMHRWVGNFFSVVVKFIVFALFTHCRHYNNINSGSFVTKPIAVAFNVYLRDKQYSCKNQKVEVILLFRAWRIIEPQGHQVNLHFVLVEIKILVTGCILLNDSVSGMFHWHQLSRS